MDIEFDPKARHVEETDANFDVVFEATCSGKPIFPYVTRRRTLQRHLMKKHIAVSHEFIKNQTDFGDFKNDIVLKIVVIINYVILYDSNGNLSILAGFVSLFTYWFLVEN